MKTGRIYKIIHNQSDIVYVGSTFNQIKHRFQQHKMRVKNNNDKRRSSLTKYLKKYGINNFKCILIKEYEVVDRKNLFAWEQLWINKLRCINEQQTFVPLIKHRNYLRKKKYRKNNIIKIRIRKKKKGKIYYEKNREEILKKKKEYSKKTMICECGKIMRCCAQARHKKSKYHLNNI